MVPRNRAGAPLARKGAGGVALFALPLGLMLAGRSGLRLRAGLLTCLGLITVLAGLALWSWGAVADTDDLRFHRIATGATGSTHYAIGGIIANAVSNPPGSRGCEQGGSCGVPGLVAVVQSTNGSLENVNAVNDGLVESALIEADVVYQAFRGTGLFNDREPAKRLRAVANLFPSTVQIIVRANFAAFSVADLRGRRVSLGEPDSGTAVTAETILSAYGLGVDDVEASYDPPGVASDRLAAGELDAMFLVSGVPSGVVEDLADRVPVRLLSITGNASEELLSFYPFFTREVIESGVYRNVGYTPTIGINTQWIISADADDDFVYALTSALWHERNRSIFDEGHPEGERITLNTALQKVAIPLHPGAARFYWEHGVVR